jgi:2-polyprenyl-3-methyl-5-hydroxy-6-metoxy-1,4-benzoquinol methylase
VKPKNLSYFRCPGCQSSDFHVAWRRDEGTEIVEGPLICGNCEASYPVENSVPRFVARENYAKSFGFQWTIHQKTQLDSQVGLPISHKRLFEVTAWPARMPGQRILEAGSGAGRFTECLVETGAEIFSFDYSTAVDSNWRNNGQASNLQLFQADLKTIPLEKRSFDKVMCLGVLQHTPDPQASFRSLAGMVRPGGELVIDVYRKDFWALLQWKYVLRPLTKRMSERFLYRTIEGIVPFLLPVAKNMRKIGGRAGARAVPIVEYSHLGLNREQNKQWAILDTFDMYSPVYDQPQTRETVQRWFAEAGFVDVNVVAGPNGLVGKGRRPTSAISWAEETSENRLCAAS